ncbi:YciI family protein [Kineosporia sp. NBRC 101731]|uniref:YciI family protein n=1 Tax=Kineosporia sp. NBRC 101731 TaxID=3032199 RepID=UPI0024A20F9D|nr:YciI family protein [Kineosporia sp. NBRC 101731]GLY32273.1 transcription initiation protein [Kineosporia sp. NBRC 101731]
MKYLMLLAIDKNVVVDEAEADPRAWDEEMERRGIASLKERLAPVTDSTTVRVRGGEVLIADGPFAETKEQIGGFCLLECDDLDQAIEVASRHPAAKFGSLELRPLYYQ